MNQQDPPGPATVVRGILGTALAVAAASLVIGLVAERSLNWELLALVLALIARLAAEHPDAPELKYVPSTTG